MTTHVEDVTTHVGLLIDGDVVPGGRGHLPGDQPRPPGRGRPRRPVDLAGAARPGRGRGAPVAAAWAGAGASRNGPRLVVAAAEAGVAAVEAGDLARLLTREHGKIYWEAVFDAGTMGGMAVAFAPLVADALAPRELSGGATRVEWVPHGVVAAILPVQLAGLGDGQQDPSRAARRRHRRRQGAADLSGHGAPRGGGHGRARCRPACSTWSTALTPALGAALVGHPGVDMVSFTGGTRDRAGRDGRRGSHDPTRRAGARRQRRRRPGPRPGDQRRPGRQARGGGVRQQRADLHGDQAPLRAP